MKTFQAPKTSTKTLASDVHTDARRVPLALTFCQTTFDLYGHKVWTVDVAATVRRCHSAVTSDTDQIAADIVRGRAAKMGLGVA